MTDRWRVAGDRCAEKFLDGISSAMEQQFGISLTEARHRIESAWADLPNGEILGETEVPDIVFHETVEYWANNFYFGKDSMWWITGEERIRMGLGPLVPIPIEEL